MAELIRTVNIDKAEEHFMSMQDPAAALANSEKRHAVDLKEQADKRKVRTTVAKVGMGVTAGLVSVALLASGAKKQDTYDRIKQDNQQELADQVRQQKIQNEIQEGQPVKPPIPAGQESSPFNPNTLGDTDRTGSQPSQSNSDRQPEQHPVVPLPPAPNQVTQESQP
jgi:hypothetical protein